MSTAARIEELQRKFDENPRRYFAPLANEHRKAGNLDAAIAICRAHLPQQPGHMSGHIVYGQALFEAGETDEARTVFETALALDPENLIALRHLGDIAARSGDRASARHWYGRVLETDPRNEEIQGLLASVDGVTPPIPMDAVPAADPMEQGLPTALDPALVDAAADAAAPEPDASPADDRHELLDFEPTSLGSSFGSSFGTDFGARNDGASPATMDHSAQSHPEPHEPPPEELFVPTALGMPDESFEPASTSASLPLSHDDTPSDSTPLQDPPALAEAPEAGTDAFVTETMAELYLQQGYRDRALDVYRQLVARDPGDLALRERMERVAQGGATDIARDFAVADVDVPGDREIAGDAFAPAIVEGSDALDASPAEPMLEGMPEALDPALLDASVADLPDTETIVATDDGYVDVVPSEPPFESPSESPPEVDSFGHAAPADDRATAAPGLSIREYLSALARGEAPRTQPSAPSNGSHQNEAASHAAEVPAVIALAEALLPAAEESAPTPNAAAATASGTGLDALFGSADPGDASRADALARAFEGGAPEPTGAATGAMAGEPTAQPMAAPDPLSGRPAHPAGEALSLDHVFGTGAGRPGNVGGPAGDAAGGGAGSASARNSGGFSFDQFFSEGASSAPAAQADAPAAPDAATRTTGSEEDDIQQFNAWLRGLKKQ